MNIKAYALEKIATMMSANAIINALSIAGNHIIKQMKHMMISYAGAM